MTSQKVPADRLGPLVGTGRTAEIYGWDDGHVLKLFHATMPVASVAAEARSAQIVTAAGLPAPAAIDPLIEVDGRHGIVYMRVDGPTMLALLANEPQRLEELAGQFGALHAQMHRHTCRELPGQHRDDRAGTGHHRLDDGDVRQPGSRRRTHDAALSHRGRSRE